MAAPLDAELVMKTHASRADAEGCQDKHTPQGPQPYDSGVGAEPLLDAGAQWKNFTVGYQCLGAPWVNRLAALLLGVFSVMLVWSEATIGIGTHDLSPFSHVWAPY